MLGLGEIYFFEIFLVWSLLWSSASVLIKRGWWLFGPDSNLIIYVFIIIFIYLFYGKREAGSGQNYYDYYYYYFILWIIWLDLMRLWKCLSLSLSFSMLATFHITNLESLWFRALQNKINYSKLPAHTSHYRPKYDSMEI